MSEEVEIFKKTAEGAAKGAVSAALQPVFDLISHLIGPSAKEVGLTWQDSIRIWRFERALALREKVERLLADRGHNLRPVSLKVLLPAFEFASLEEDDYLQEHWATLLANAADPTHRNNMLPAFAEILKQLTANEARLLNYLYQRRSDIEKVTADGTTIIGLIDALSRAYAEIRTPPFAEQAEGLGSEPSEDDIEIFVTSGEEISVVVGNLMRLGLIAQRQVPEPVAGHVMTGYESQVEQYYFTILGKWFVESCGPRQEFVTESSDATLPDR